ncbi:MAG: hypothetical protein MJY62_06640 [Bacteroidales bacterium]|nr:hypothetical protein [Bacteroidales bacterium]
MNIPVKTYNGRIYCRPDASRDKEDKDIYLPDSVTALYWVPVVFVKIGRAGKCIGEKFVGRYLESYSPGALLYEASAYEAGDLATSTCMDHMSILPVNLRPLQELDDRQMDYILEVGGETVCSLPCSEWKRMLEKAVVDVTARLTVHIGDLVCVELCEPVPLEGAKKENALGFKGVLTGEQIFNFSFIFPR